MGEEWGGIIPISGEIVIVEDDLLIRPLIVELLENLRAKIVTFTTADDAVTYLLESHGYCSLLITDHGLPGAVMGSDLVAMFRAKWPRVPVIVTSGYELDSRSFPVGVAFLQKPWPVDLFIETVAGLLQPGFPPRRH
jgi:CheY-like chemotaxis protein